MRLAVHIGYHRTGTTWIQQRFLPRHPEVLPLCDSAKPWTDALLRYLITQREEHYSQEHARALLERQRDMAVRAARESAGSGAQEPAVGIISAERLCGHPLSGGYDRARLAQRLRSTLGAADVVIVVRNQPEALWSVYRQMVKGGYPGSFTRRLEDGISPPWKSTRFTLGFYEYDALVRYYRRLFGDAHVHVLAFERFQRDPQAYVREWCRALGVEVMEASALVPAEVVNKGLPDQRLRARRILNAFRHSEYHEFPILRVSPRLDAWLERPLARLTGQAGGPDSSTTGWILDQYRDANHRLACLAGDSLSPFVAATGLDGGQGESGG